MRRGVFNAILILIISSIMLGIVLMDLIFWMVNNIILFNIMFDLIVFIMSLGVLIGGLWAFYESVKEGEESNG